MWILKSRPFSLRGSSRRIRAAGPRGVSGRAGPNPGRARRYTCHRYQRDGNMGDPRLGAARDAGEVAATFVFPHLISFSVRPPPAHRRWKLRRPNRLPNADFRPGRSHSPKSQPRPTVTMQPETPRRAFHHSSQTFCATHNRACPTLAAMTSSGCVFPAARGSLRLPTWHVPELPAPAAGPNSIDRGRASTVTTAARCGTPQGGQISPKLGTIRSHGPHRNTAPADPDSSRASDHQPQIDPVHRADGIDLPTRPRCDSCPICNNLPLVVCPESGDTLRE